MITIKLLCNWTTTYDLSEKWTKMLPPNSDLQLITEKDLEPDFYIIINGTSDRFVHSKTIIFMMEPYHEKYFPSHERAKFLLFLDHSVHPNLSEWHLSFSYSNLLNYSPNKTKVLSSVVSSKYEDPGHKLRINFLKEYEKNNNIDLYGVDNKMSFKNYKYPLPYMKKDMGLFPYKYHINVENNAIPNYFTEKICDAILSECLIFYQGAPNITDHIDPRAFIMVDFSDITSTTQIINKAIENGEWEKRLPYIREMKRQIITKMSVFQRISYVINSIKKQGVLTPSHH